MDKMVKYIGEAGNQIPCGKLTGVNIARGNKENRTFIYGKQQ